MADVQIVSKVWGEEHWIINRDYAGKKMVLFKGRQCSLHLHKVKDETFYVNKGKVLLEVSGERRLMLPGDAQLIMPYQLHRFTAIGADAEIFEFSTHHYDTIDTDNFRVEHSQILDRSLVKTPDVYITGIFGYLGRSMSNFFSSKGYKTTGSDVEFVDITNRTVLLAELNLTKPKLIIHTAAMSNWRACENNPELAEKVNVEATKTIVDYCKLNSVPLVYISTDFIFSGSKEFYNENDSPDPINVYGSTKALAEDYVRTHNQHYIIRTGTFYGVSYIVDRPVFAHKVIRRLSQKVNYSVATDEVSTPTLIQDIAKAVYLLSQDKLFGTYNVAGSDSISRYNYALKIAETFKLEKTLLNPLTMLELDTETKRPKRLSLNTSKLIDHGIVMSSLDKGISIMFQDYMRNQTILNEVLGS
jgi:dTDP-4-dehydrorhamnose reductase